MIFKNTIWTKNKLKSNGTEKTQRFSVSMKLNIVNFLIIISSLISIIGAYEIQIGGKMHELNYFHQKYITQLVKTVKSFEVDSVSTNDVRKDIMLVREQPIKCIELIGSFEILIMKLIGTKNILQVCHDDLAVADNLLQKVQEFDAAVFDKKALTHFLYQGINEFEYSGMRFEPLVSKTVRVLFFIVISILITKAFIVPLIGLILSNSVAQDYQLLLITKTNLEEEKQRNALIQSERIESLTIMVAGMAHEINTPIGISITANSYLGDTLGMLRKSYEDQELTKSKFDHFIAEMEKSNTLVMNNLSRTAKLVKSFKEVSVDQFVDELQNIKLKPYIEQILVSLVPVTQSANIKFKLCCDNDIQASIYGGVFSQIFTNLVTNAINHAFQDKEAGIISISVKESSDNEIHFSFEDDGCGISEIDKIHIFAPFFTTKRGEGGTGLGLHILHNLVTDKLQGRILCTSEIGTGTRFDIYFPKIIKVTD
ncbi:HAMP domain-containing sensor histidine kinase [Colwellia sp. 1_MG-2023]|uniref:sensor histidine kinase n=1 Tax=unclassified Colwellia TaxID=196834 RepID=UPI001C09B2D6|nr:MULTISPECIES: HAMP domain-containing sensor histidine kinase [unclassified Colwellia]MBU2926318.1 HAMP domain-containing histidine kinase [Colwellia sp. C2M11]MDO6651756.1 HAMP domain-containing sensor histidine kinase [Colwellia sp. 3_MG-2023]MDO6665333.1 HAMP domain-containing sensor histidine kinase [Colwellia sp. 2_MG-2023]MDO6689706.1 HAMP domain-containing sensor histidine kinase [Colwellia sp. 1_MG-2023]